MQPSLLPETCRRRLQESLPLAAGQVFLPRPPGSAAAALCAVLAEKSPARLALAVVPGPSALETLIQDWRTLNPEWPATSLWPALDDEAESTELRNTQIEALREISHAANRPGVLLTCAQLLPQPLPDPEAVSRRTIRLRLGGQLPPAQADSGNLAPLLSDHGYSRVETVYQVGDFAVRGGIIDLWPPDRDQPLRIELFDTDIDSLRVFDPATQRTTLRLDEASIPPVKVEPSAGGATLADFLPEGFALLWLDDGDHDCFPSDYECRPRLGKPSIECFSGRHKPAGAILWPVDWEPVPGLADTGAGGAPPDAMAAAREELFNKLRTMAEEGWRVIVFADTPGVRDHLRKDLADSAMVLATGVLSGGFAMPEARSLVVAQTDLYGRRARPLPRGPRYRGGEEGGERIETPESLQAGDLVVHLEHGIGRFLEISEIETGGRRSEVLSIEYAEGARLHVPLAQCHLLSRYIGIGGHGAKLHRLGGKRWRKERAAAERAVADLAASLLETQARRQIQNGRSFDVNPPWMHEFETAFPYPETPDQVRTMMEIKQDLAAGKPMDRLVCGDAGYGKTEMAVRAAFIAVMQGRQVAVLTPTTVLAEQHERTFRDRLAPYPVRIETLSRFRTRSQRHAVLQGMRQGTVDIVIGTHTLLWPGISFKDLGLVVIDEEQRFGVAHKEKLKQVRALVDVLTLTATPIPRTMYLSMTGVRDMSLLQTPPSLRQDVKTEVVEDSDDVIRQAISREIRREGQVFFLYNRVMTLPRMLARLRALAPEITIGVAHGQMPARELQSVMRDFARGEIDLLLCTTIVESGLDIPRANTILIHRADRFGMADLYQLRGRVGRSDRKAYALLLLPPRGSVEDNARRRLEALQRHGGAGAGFQLALRDLEIRGGGNLLGAAQSGHIAAIGFGLYCQLLRRTVSRFEGQAPRPVINTVLQLDFVEFSPSAVHCPAAFTRQYIADDATRLSLHKKLAEAVSPQEVDELGRELADRFGPLPSPARRLLKLACLRINAALRGIHRVESRGGTVLLFRDGKAAAVNKCLQTGNPDKKIEQLLRLVEAKTL